MDITVMYDGVKETKKTRMTSCPATGGVIQRVQEKLGGTDSEILFDISDMRMEGTSKYG